jgi:ubiquinone/menaquinone biosynthesis C-methylase UbiE
LQVLKGSLTSEEMNDRTMSNLGFRVIALTFRVRDFLRPRKEILKEVGIEEGFRVLDFGCGPGSYVRVVAELVGKSGKVYALDINPLAIQMVKEIAKKNQLANVETILSDCKTGLPRGSVDVVLLYDIFHDLTNAEIVLEELRRVLKRDGILSFSDHHMKEDEIISKVTIHGLFRLQRKGTKTYSSVKAQAKSEA